MQTQWAAGGWKTGGAGGREDLSDVTAAGPGERIH